MVATVLNISLWVLSIIIYIIYNLYQKNLKLERIVNSQNNLLQALKEVITESDRRLKEFDRQGIYKSDDETGTFFKMIKEIQSILNEFFRND